MSGKCTYCGGNHWRPDCEEIAKEQSAPVKERKMLTQDANKKIFEWAMGGKIDPFNLRLMPDFSEPAPAFGLLDVLVERGYHPQLC